MVLEKTLSSPMDCKIQPVHPKWDQSWMFIWKEWCWSWNSNTLATWYEQLTHWKRSWCWEWLRSGGERDNRGWDGWMASPTQWTWVWGNSGSWWWTGRPGMLQSMGSQKVRWDWVTELISPPAAFQSLQWAPKELRMGKTNHPTSKHRILAQDSWDAYERNDFSEPRFLHLPSTWKCLIP